MTRPALLRAAPKPGDPPERAAEFFRSKGIRPSFDFRDVWGIEHTHAFTVAKAMQRDLLVALQEEMQRSLDEGTPFDEFRKELKPRLERSGWWGEREVTDPKTGRKETVDFGSPSRLRTVYFHNTRSSHAVGQWQRIQSTKESHEFLVYQIGPAEVHRELHVAWEGTTLPVDDPWWADHYPPNGYNCHCHVRQVRRSKVDREGGPTPRPPYNPIEVVNTRTGRRQTVDRGLDPEWAHNPGAERLNPLTEKLEPAK